GYVDCEMKPGIVSTAEENFFASCRSRSSMPGRTRIPPNRRITMVALLSPRTNLGLDQPCPRPYERLRPSVQFGDPSVGVQARRAVPSFDLSILADADSDQPGCATDPHAFALSIALHHRRVRGQGR